MKDQSVRRKAREILSKAAENGRDELERSVLQLGVSGIAGGFTLGLTGLIVAAVQGMLGSSPAAELASYLFYPVGFIAVIIGRQQLFTENTLYPVVLALEERGYVLRTLRLWGVVFSANILGAFFFALLAERTPALQSPTADQLVHLGLHAVALSHADAFWSGFVGGWIIAMVAWLVTASQFTIGVFAVTWLLTFLVGYGKFAHCVASSTEILAAVATGAVPARHYFAWLGATTCGNIVGGVVIVGVLNWAQASQMTHSGQE